MKEVFEGDYVKRDGNCEIEGGRWCKARKYVKKDRSEIPILVPSFRRKVF